MYIYIYTYMYIYICYPILGYGCLSGKVGRA